MGKDLASRILYEDNHLIIVNKLGGEIVQGDKTGDIPLADMIKAYLKKKYLKPGEVFLGVVHRIDRPVSGAVIFARTSKALARLNNMLKERRITKIYWAVVKNTPSISEGTLVHHLRRNEKQNKTYVYDHPTQNTTEASLSYKVLGESDNYFLVQIELHTGRHHQIRAQLAHIGCPIKGDLKYGAERSNPGGFIHLHSIKTEFIHPVKREKLSIVAPPPLADPLWEHFYHTYRDLL
ncbi:MAG: RluA family pseudouridine synthase [Bacteroidales bacterium]